MGRVDVLVVSLGSTPGLRAADDALLGGLRRVGASAALVRADPPREVRTLALTDLAWALAARRAARAGVAAHAPRAVLHSTTTAALLSGVRGAIRFDALGAVNRPGRHGTWQRAVEARRLRAATLLVPWATGSLEGAPAGAARAVIVPVAVAASGPAVPWAARDVAAVTYASDPHKKGLDRVLAAWAAARRPGEVLVVCGARPGLVPRADGVRDAGLLAPEAFRALLRRTRAFVTAPRREDHGLAQLEALADGCALVTTAAPGPYAALEIARTIAPQLVGDDLAGALRRALDAGGAPDARRALEPLTPDGVDATLRDVLLPALLG